MKRFKSIFICLFLLLSLFMLISCNKTDGEDGSFIFAPQENHTPESQKYTGITASAVQSEYKTSTEKIEVTVTDNSENLGFIVQRFLGLEKYEDGKWVSVPFSKKVENAYLCAEDYWDYIEPGDNTETDRSVNMTLETKNLYEPLKAGKYRAVIYLGDGTELYAEFDAVN